MDFQILLIYLHLFITYLFTSTHSYLKIIFFLKIYIFLQILFLKIIKIKNGLISYYLANNIHILVKYLSVFRGVNLFIYSIF